MEQLERDICYLKKIIDRLEATTAELSNTKRNKAIDETYLAVENAIEQMESLFNILEQEAEAAWQEQQ